MLVLRPRLCRRFDHQEIIPSIFLGMYGFLAALEAGIDFCMVSVRVCACRLGVCGLWRHPCMLEAWCSSAGLASSCARGLWRFARSAPTQPLLHTLHSPDISHPLCCLQGCVMFGWAVKFGLIPKEVYTVGASLYPCLSPHPLC